MSDFGMKIEWLEGEHGLWIGGALVALLTDDQVIALDRAAAIAVCGLRGRRAAESASHTMHAMRMAANTTRAADLTGPIDLEI